MSDVTFRIFFSLHLNTRFLGRTEKTIIPNVGRPPVQQRDAVPKEQIIFFVFLFIARN